MDCKNCNREIVDWDGIWIHFTPTNMLKEFCYEPEPFGHSDNGDEK